MAWKNHKPKTVAPIKDASAKRENIFVAIPVRTGSDNLGIGVYRFLHLLQAMNFQPGFPYHFEWQIVIDKYPIEWARNLLVGLFLKSKSSRLWFVDNDMVPHENFMEILKSDADITGAMALAFDHANEQKQIPTRIKPCIFQHNPDAESFNSIVPQQGDVEIEVDALGTATMLIRRKVLEDRRLWGPVEYTDLRGEPRSLDDERSDHDWAPPVFRFLRKPNGNGLRGEDIDFSWRAKQLGYRVTAFPGVRVGHQKQINLDSVLDLVNSTAEKYGSALLAEAAAASRGKE